MRKFLPVLLLLIVVLALAQVALAKGPADMVSVSGPRLDGEFSTTRADIVLDLSLGYFETSCREPVGDIELLAEGYTIRRYYQIGDGSFHMHDSFTYYPRTDQQGVVNSVHFDDASSGHPEHWTCASEQGEEAFLRLLAEAGTQPYLMLAQADGMLHIADPQSLVQIAEIDLAAAYPSHIRSTAGGQALRYQAADGSVTQQLMLNLESGTQCLQEAISGDEGVEQQVIESGDGRWRALITQSPERTVVDLEHMSMEWANSHRLQPDPLATYSGAWDASGIRFYLTDGATIYRFEPLNEGRMREQTLSLPAAAAARAPLEIAGVVNDIAYVYHPQEEGSAAEGQGDLPGGIFVVNALTGEQIDHLQPELSFAHIILTDGGLYAVQSRSNGANTHIVYALDRADGSIMAEESLQGDVSDAAYGSLNPALLSSTASPVTVANCPDDTSPFVSVQDPLAALPQN